MKRKLLLIAGLLLAAGSMLPLSARVIKTERTDADYAARYGKKERADLLRLLKSDKVSAQEKDALKFLYSYLPTTDIADYTPDFYLANIRAALKASEEMPWGKTVPDREFRHFVLPVRVNNENMDMSRPAMYAELKDRIKGLSMEDAILEVNHWCHEKVTYQPSDGRTKSPFAAMRSALGRCGEESTFTVAALRAVGIPARQIYTPRWAHTDDNHAWVEAWANGKWYFLGACEPEPVLNLGWFNSPASRGMLMNTKVFGNYDGPEEVLDRSIINTNINVTSNYAPVGTVKAQVVDETGKPVKNADVIFCIYNYAEFYPAVRRKADVNGEASLIAGLGDLVVWATDGKKFGFAKASVKNPARVVLNRDSKYTGSEELDIVPPQPTNALPKLTAEQVAANDRRKVYEDSIRMAYVATFYDAERSKKLANELGLDEKGMIRVMTASRGNYPLIEKFLRSVAADKRDKALRLLSSISAKDLNDVPYDVLTDHLATEDQDTPMFDYYIMNPRIANEWLTPYKGAFAKEFTPAQRKQFKANPQQWISWVVKNIAIDNKWNPVNTVITPMGVLRERLSDENSRSIFFVAGARSFGIPARIDPVTGKTQYADSKGEWLDVNFEKPTVAAAAPKGEVAIEYAVDGSRLEPKYYSQFSISKIENGEPYLQGFAEETKLSDMKEHPIMADEGQYILITGRRMADGSVLAKADIYNVEEGKTTSVPLVVRHSNEGVEVIGNVNAEDIYLNAATGEKQGLIATTGRGYYVLGLINPNHEPSAHALNDISAMKSDFEKWGKKLMLILPDGEAIKRFDNTLFPNLPSNAVIGADVDGRILADVKQGLNLTSEEMPVFIIADTFNRVVFMLQGYSIGLGERLLDVINQLHD